MVSALYNSRVDGTKPNRFRQGKDGVSFGWEAIEDMLKRELKRIQSGQLVRVQGLKESFVHRDTWTRLNVKPAKIMQVMYKHNTYTYIAIVSIFFIKYRWYDTSKNNMC